MNPINALVAFFTARFTKLKEALIAVRSDLIARINSEAAARQQADELLSGRIDSEAAARAAADTALDTKITQGLTSLEATLTAETAARAEADTQIRVDLAAAIQSEKEYVLDQLNQEQLAREAADMALGARIDTEAANRAAGDAAVLAQAIQASQMNVRKGFFVDVNALGAGDKDLGQVLASSGLDLGLSSLENGSYAVFFSGSAQATSVVTGLVDTTGAAFSKSVSNGDIYYFNVNGGLIESGIFADDKNQVKFDAVDVELSGLQAATTQLRTDVDGVPTVIDNKITEFATMFYNQLVAAGYEDPNF